MLHDTQLVGIQKGSDIEKTQSTQSCELLRINGFIWEVRNRHRKYRLHGLFAELRWYVLTAEQTQISFGSAYSVQNNIVTYELPESESFRVLKNMVHTSC